jgi:hypothetical protein
MKPSTATTQPVKASRFHAFRTGEFSTYYIPIAVTFVLCGLILEFCGHHLIAALFYLAASLAITGHTGFEIDTEQQWQRFYSSYIGIKFGAWQPLRKYDRLGARLCRRGASNLATWRPVKADFYKLFLFTGVPGETICVGFARNIETANEKAERLTLALPGIEIIRN